MTRVTSADVAKEAGVSSMTVSRVVNNKGDIRPATREKVERAIEKLGYRPNRLARALTLKETRTLGFVVPDISNPFFSELIRGAEDAAWERGYALIVCSTVESLEREARTLALLEERHVDGLIVCSPRLPEKDLLERLSQPANTLLVNRHLARGESASLEIDDMHGAMRAVHHLLSGGRETLGLLAGPENAHSGKLRLAGYRSALETTGREVSGRHIKHCYPDENGGYEGTKMLLKDSPGLEGLLCYNDLVAIGALQACHELGVSVPDDLAIVGCDDIRMARLTNPPLTTLRVDKLAMGERAVEMLLKTLTEDAPKRHEPVVEKPDLVVRASAP